MGMVLRKAGIDESNWKEVASALGLSQGFIEGLFKTGMSWIGKYGFKDVLSNWQEQESSRGGYVSWEKLAEAIQNVKKYGVDYSQTILEISGEGGVVVFNCIINGYDRQKLCGLVNTNINYLVLLSHYATPNFITIL